MWLGFCFCFQNFSSFCLFHPSGVNIFSSYDLFPPLHVEKQKHNAVELYITFVSCLTYSVVMFLSDMSGRVPLYKKYVKNFYFHLEELSIVFLLVKQILFSTILTLDFRAYVFFSTPVSKDLVNRIKNDTSVLPRIGALREVKNYHSSCTDSCILNSFPVLGYFSSIHDILHVCLVTFRWIWSTFP